MEYHDTIWGRIETDDTALFRKLSLDLMQAGLSWQTILNKTASFDQAFDNFDLKEVSCYNTAKVKVLKNDAGIIRNQMKIEAIIHNAQIILALQQKGISFFDYLSQQIPNGHLENHWQMDSEVPAKTILSDKIAKKMKHDGFKFVGSTVIYAFLQATGFINDHVEACFCHEKAEDKKQ
jgi:DNA-3-methyladenine glycosylase I